MTYFKHLELIDKYHISLKTVHNWIDAAKQGKINLELYEQNGRTYIANNPSNIVILENLAEQGKKYRNARFHTVATPKPAFYDLFSRQQILDIITKLNVHREIPRQYNYFDQGGVNWDKYIERMAKEPGLNMLKGTINLLHANLGTIDRLLEGYNQVNIIDVGPGNAMPVRELLGHLLQRGILHRYIAVDISETMLRIAESNIKQWFGGKVRFEGYVRDVTHEHFDDLLVDDMLDTNAAKTINLALLFGGTSMNCPKPSDILKVICSSLGQDDLLIYADRPDSVTARRSFDFNPDPNLATLSPTHRFIFDLLNIDELLYDVEMGYNQQEKRRYVRVRLKKALTIKFRFENGERSVELDKGETILLLRVWHMSALEIISDFEKAGFTLLQSSMTKDRRFLLTISGVDAKQHA